MTGNMKSPKGITIELITPSSPLFSGRLEASVDFFENQACHH